MLNTSNVSVIPIILANEHAHNALLYVFIFSVAREVEK